LEVETLEDKYVVRSEYLHFLEKWRGKEVVKVVSGVRRSGKSTLFKLFRKSLINEGVLDDHIIVYNFEDPKFRHLLEAYDLYDDVDAKIKDDNQYYVFFDEIQNVNSFEKVVDGLFIRENIDVYITGSNAYFLSGELATLLTGRYVQLDIFPLSFKEFYQWKTKNNDEFSLKTKNEVYVDYLNSSFPYVLQLKSSEEVVMYLQSIFSSIMYKDVIPRLNTTDTMALERVATLLASVTGTQVSINKIKNTFVSSGTKISFETVKKYIGGLSDSLLFYSARPFNIRGRELLKTSEKYYLVDPGLRRIMLPDANSDMGHILENVIFIELKRRGFDVFVGKVDNLEVDFVAIDKMQNIEYYQVSLDTLAETTLTRELKSLQAIQDSYPKYLLTLDTVTPEANYGGIKKMNALDWLLGKK
jgi:predicted AAA+ superfamily ATPase